VDVKRTPSIASIWVARNRFATLDKSHQLSIRDLQNQESRKIDYSGPIDDIFYAGTGLLLLKNPDSVSIYDVQQKRILVSLKVSKVSLKITFF
jgi:coatomer subunit alpha